MANQLWPNNPEYNIYVGARYVPIFSGEWDETRKYENLEIVNYQGKQYTSRSYVPVGTPPTDTTYWVESSDFNPDLDALQKEVDNHEGRITANEAAIKELQDGAGQIPDIDDLKTDVADLKTSQATQDTKIADLEATDGVQDTAIQKNAADITAINATQTVQDGKISTLEASQGTQDGKISALETSQATQDTKISGLETSQTAQDGKITALETSQASQDTEIAAIKAEQETFATDIEALQTENAAQQDAIDALKAAGGDLPEELEGIISKNREQDTKLETLDTVTKAQTTQITNIFGDISGIKTKNQTQDQQITALETSQEEQDTKIAALEARQTAQDTTISAVSGRVDTIDEAQTEIQRQLTELETGEVPLPYVKLAGDTMSGPLSFKDAGNNTWATINCGGESLMLAGGTTQSGHLTVTDNYVSTDKRLAVSGTVSAEPATQNNELMRLDQCDGRYLRTDGQNTMLSNLKLKPVEGQADSTEISYGTPLSVAFPTIAFNWKRDIGQLDCFTGATGNQDFGQQVRINGLFGAQTAHDATNADFVATNYLKLAGTNRMTGQLNLPTLPIGYSYLNFSVLPAVKISFARDNENITYVTSIHAGNNPSVVVLGGLKDPIDSWDAATKHYVDTAVASAGGGFNKVNLNVRCNKATVFSSYSFQTNELYLRTRVVVNLKNLTWQNGTTMTLSITGGSLGSLVSAFATQTDATSMPLGEMNVSNSSYAAMQHDIDFHMTGIASGTMPLASVALEFMIVNP